MSPAEIEAILNEAMPADHVEVQGEGGKFLLSIVSTEFAGLNAVKRQQAVYRIINPHIASGVIHAVSMNLKTPEEV